MPNLRRKGKDATKPSAAPETHIRPCSLKDTGFVAKADKRGPRPSKKTHADPRAAGSRFPFRNPQRFVIIVGSSFVHREIPRTLEVIELSKKLAVAGRLRRTEVKFRLT